MVVEQSAKSLKQLKSTKKNYARDRPNRKATKADSRDLRDKYVFGHFKMINLCTSIWLSSFLQYHFKFKIIYVGPILRIPPQQY